MLTHQYGGGKKLTFFPSNVCQRAHPKNNQYNPTLAQRCRHLFQKENRPVPVRSTEIFSFYLSLPRTSNALARESAREGPRTPKAATVSNHDETYTRQSMKNEI